LKAAAGWWWSGVATTYGRRLEVQESVTRKGRSNGKSKRERVNNLEKEKKR
jgi:hypothetical protein